MTGTRSDNGNAREFTLGVIEPNPLGVSRDIVCTFTNTSLVAPVTITKTVVDAFGQNPLPGVGWSVAAAATATSGTVTQTPAASQTTNAQGAASWGVRFGTADSVATVNVSETQQSDYLFSSGTCTITPPTGAPRTVTLTGEAATPITGVRPGESVACAYTNRLKPTYLTLVKSVSSPYGGQAAPGGWTLGATGGATLSGASGTAAVTKVQVPAGTYALAETNGPTGYTLTGLGCTTAEGTPIAGVSPTSPTVALAIGADVTCTFTNTEQPSNLTLVKVVDNGQTGTSAVPGNWTLTATPVDITGQAPVSGAGNSPAVTNQTVFSGSYDLSESGGPAGFQPGTWSCTGGTLERRATDSPERQHRLLHDHEHRDRADAHSRQSRSSTTTVAQPWPPSGR